MQSTYRPVLGYHLILRLLPDLQTNLPVETAGNTNGGQCGACDYLQWKRQAFVTRGGSGGISCAFCARACVRVLYRQYFNSCAGTIKLIVSVDSVSYIMQYGVTECEKVVRVMRRGLSMHECVFLLCV